MEIKSNMGSTLRKHVGFTEMAKIPLIIIVDFIREDYGCCYLVSDYWSLWRIIPVRIMHSMRPEG